MKLCLLSRVTELEQLNSTPHPTLGSPDRPNPPSEQAAEQIDPIPEADPTYLLVTLYSV